MKITPQDINNHEFKRSIRGYDMDEVDAFLTQVAIELERLVTENQELKDTAKSGGAGIDEYRKKNELLQKTLLAAQDVTEKIKTTSQQEMEHTTRTANFEAEKIINRANEKAAVIIGQIDDLKRQRDAFVIQFKALLDTYYKFLSELKKSDFEAMSAIKARAADAEPNTTEDAIPSPEQVKESEPANISTEPDVPQIGNTAPSATTPQGPLANLGKLDFDDLIREDTSEDSAGDDSDEGDGEPG